MADSREGLVSRLRGRRLEIEQALTARTAAIRGADRDTDPEYREALRATIAAAFDYCLLVIESGEGVPPPLPVEIIAQARLAGRLSIGLDSVLRGYVAGSAVLDEFVLEEVGDLDPQPILRARGVALELLLAKVAGEYERERRDRRRSREERVLCEVINALSGRRIDGSRLNYEFDRRHLGLVAGGPDVMALIKELARTLDGELLLVRPNDEVAWGWLGRFGPIHAEQVQELADQRTDSHISLAIGEPADGIAGWRQTHLQARAAFRVAVSSSAGSARYSDVCLLASALRDDLLITSLRQIYLDPLLNGRDGGAAYLKTLRAYFSCQQNAASAAALLGVSRQAVANRLRAIEGRLGRPLTSCSAEMVLALSLADK